jgi:hypothetical protein
MEMNGSSGRNRRVRENYAVWLKDTLPEENQGSPNDNCPLRNTDGSLIFLSLETSENWL